MSYIVNHMSATLFGWVNVAFECFAYNSRNVIALSRAEAQSFHRQTKEKRRNKQNSVFFFQVGLKGFALVKEYITTSCCLDIYGLWRML